MRHKWLQSRSASASQELLTGHNVRGKGSKLILSIVLKKFEILSQYGPLLQLICEINVELQSGKEWARTLVAALLPPVGSAGSRHRKYSCRRGELDINFLGRPTPILKKYGGGGMKYQEGSLI